MPDKKGNIVVTLSVSQEIHRALRKASMTEGCGVKIPLGHIARKAIVEWLKKRGYLEQSAMRCDMGEP